MLPKLPGSSGGEALAVSDDGRFVVGWAAVGGVGHAVRWHNGHVRDLGTLAGGQSSAYDINDHGVAVGSSTCPGTQPDDECNVAVRWGRRGHITNLGSLRGGAKGGSVATAINDHGVIVGASWSRRGTRPVVWRGGVIAHLPLLPGVFTSSIGASGINDRGQIVGTTTVDGQWHATLWRHATATDLGVGEAVAINRWGVIVGFLPNPQGGFDSGYATVMWTRRTHRIIDLESRITTPGWTLTGLGGINADGQIAGNGHLNGAPKAFLLVPTG